jgi:hypothetical protein
MNNRELAIAVKDVLNAINRSEKLSVDILAAKARKYAQANPTDVPVVTASQVLTKMASRQSFIPRTEFNSFINGLHTTQTKLSQIFAEEMQQHLLQEPQVFKRANDEGQSLDRDYERVADPILTNALSNIFEDQGPLKLYSEATAKRANRACQAGLLSIGFEPKRVETWSGQEDIILCAATYETPKGDARVLVPIEIQQDHALLPTVFVSQAGFTDLSAEAVWQHINATAGKPLRVNGEKILQLLNLAKNGGQKKVASDVEMAIIQMKSARGQSGDVNGIVGIRIDEVQDNVDTTVGQTVEELSLSQRLARPDGVAQFVHGEQAIDAGRRLLERKMAQFGHRGAQIKVAGSDEQQVVFAVSIGNHIGFNVPVKVQSGMVLPPAILISNGEMKSFSADEVTNLVKSGSSDTRALAQSSRYYHLRPTQLLEQVKQACIEGNFAKAEDCINVLGEIDTNAQKVAIANMLIYLKNESGTSEDLKKVASTPVYDVPYFMTHKVFFPDGV